MALQMSFTAPDGAVYPQCFIFIATIQQAPQVLVLPANVVLYVNYYADKATLESGMPPFMQSTLQPDPTVLEAAGNNFDLSYDWMLTLPEFTGAVIVPTADFQ